MIPDIAAYLIGAPLEQEGLSPIMRGYSLTSTDLNLMGDLRQEDFGAVSLWDLTVRHGFIVDDFGILFAFCVSFFVLFLWELRMRRFSDVWRRLFGYIPPTGKIIALNISSPAGFCSNSSSSRCICTMPQVSTELSDTSELQGSCHPNRNYTVIAKKTRHMISEFAEISEMSGNGSGLEMH